MHKYIIAMLAAALAVSLLLNVITILHKPRAAESLIDFAKIDSTIWLLKDLNKKFPYIILRSVPGSARVETSYVTKDTPIGDMAPARYRKPFQLPLFSYKNIQYSLIGEAVCDYTGALHGLHFDNVAITPPYVHEDTQSKPPDKPKTASLFLYLGPGLTHRGAVLSKVGTIFYYKRFAINGEIEAQPLIEEDQLIIETKLKLFALYRIPLL